MTQFDTHFARVLPIVGPAIGERRVGLIGCAAGAEVAALLAASGVLRWALAAGSPAAPTSPLGRLFGPAYTRQAAQLALARALRAQHSARLPWAFVPLAKVNVELLLAAGDERTLGYARAIAAQRRCPLVAMPAEPYLDPLSWADGFPLEVVQGDPPTYITPDPYAAAAVARAILLRGTPYARPDIERLLEPAGSQAHGALPAAFETARIGAVRPFITPVDAPALRERAALVIGLGSLGSYIAAGLGRSVGKLVVADGATVSAANPARQLYTAARVGRPKASALADELHARLGEHAPHIVAIERNLVDENELAALLAEQQLDLAVLATGTTTDFALARALRAAGVPHLAVRCYPRARYWEAVLVPDAASPCLGCLRGHLYTGPMPTPTPEESARYAAPGDLQAEPASLIESGWAAACMARLGVQLLAPPGLREPWFAALLTTGRSCLIGGAYAADGDTGPAYGIGRPGQVRAYGVEMIVGSAATRVCADCGRSWPVGYISSSS